MTLWRGRLPGEPAEELWAFTASLGFDRRLAACDVAGSRAHVRGLERAGLVESDEAATLLAALDVVDDELARGAFRFAAGDEDIHTAVERRVTEIAGPAGAKLHTGRSRNDQVATDLRLWTKQALLDVADGVLAMMGALHERAVMAHDAGVVLPGYTHLQRAQPVLLAHHLLAHGWALARDVDRLMDGYRRLDISPLGAGALAGSTLPLDPDGVAQDLGFSARFENSMDAVSDRDFVAEALFVLALLGVHLSRIGEELVLWSSAEFGFVRLHDSFVTGSSMLPQKANPDIAELARGKAGRLVGHLTGLLVTLKGLPLAYNRDLQEDKEPLFDAVDQVTRALSALTGALATATFDAGRMAAAADTHEAAAVALAEWLVAGGTRFREAHTLVGGLVREAAERGVSLGDLARTHPALGPAAEEVLGAGEGTARLRSPGGGGPEPVGEQLRRFGERLDTDRRRVPR